MKQVFNTNEVAHIWAQQSQQSGRNQGGNFYFEGATIYSYGGHFPIATIKGNDVFFTKRTYSNTTAKHIGKARAAISHKNIIYVHSVPVGNFSYLTATHEENFNHWKRQIKAYFGELGNKRIRDTQSRVNSIQSLINELTVYCDYFKLPVKDKELKNFIKLSQNPDFISIAREAKEKAIKQAELKYKQAAKAYDKYLEYWRNFREDKAAEELPEKIKDLCRFYQSNTEAFTRLRFNSDQNRVETSKGVQIPAEIAKRAYIALNGCLAQSCNGLSIPVLSYTITETGKDYIKAGCHTIPKKDIEYIANLLNW